MKIQSIFMFFAGIVGALQPRVHKLAKFSTNSYRPSMLKQKQQLITFPHHCGVSVFDERTSTTIVFRGTNNIYDWLFNIELCLTKSPHKGKVHKGFF